MFENILNKLVKRIEEKKGLSIFARQRSKFEGWLKVELVDILKSKNKDVRIEHSIGKKKVDVFFDNYLIELKTVNTNYRHDGVEKKIRPITDNIKGIKEDIKKIIYKKNYNKAILFVVFPLSDKDENFWGNQLNEIENEMKNKTKVEKEIEFCFKNSKIPGKIYFYLFN